MNELIKEARAFAADMRKPYETSGDQRAGELLALLADFAEAASQTILGEALALAAKAVAKAEQLENTIRQTAERLREDIAGCDYDGEPIYIGPGALELLDKALGLTEAEAAALLWEAKERHRQQMADYLTGLEGRDA